MNKKFVWSELIVLFCLIRWIFKQIGCDFTSFIVLFTSCSSIYLISLISIERFMKVKRPLAKDGLKLERVRLLIVCALLTSFTIAILPVLGVSEYSVDSTLTSCTINLNKRTLGATVYLLIAILMVFLLPFLVIIFTSAFSFIKVKFPFFKYITGSIN
jgi:hypothetical protein